MAQYKVVAVIWDDHMRANRMEIHNDPELLITSTITFGALIKTTKRALVILSDLERYHDRDDGSYAVILRKTIQAVKEYGDIEIDNLKVIS